MKAARWNLNSIQRAPRWATGRVICHAARQSIPHVSGFGELLFVAGAGWTKKQKDGAVHVEQAGKLILGFLAASGASLGSRKSLVDLSNLDANCGWARGKADVLPVADGFAVMEEVNRLLA